MGEHDSDAVAAAAATLQAGGVIAHATEGVWGLAADARSSSAVTRLLALKQRSWRKGLIMVGDEPAVFASLLARLTPAQRAAVDASWPGHVTWLLPHGGTLPTMITGGSSVAAVRVSAHYQVSALCRAMRAIGGGAIVSTSANRAEAPAHLSEADVRADFGTELDYILSGTLGGAAGPSVIRSLDGATVRG